MKILKLFLSILFSFIIPNVFAQSPSTIESDLLKSFKKIAFTNNEDNEKANDEFAKKLKIYTEKYPATINQKFNLLFAAHLNICTSEDGLFRIYSWDTQAGGTMHFFENVFQYKSGAVTKAVIDTPRGEGDNRPNYQKIYTFQANNKTYYLCTYLTIGSTKDVGQGIQVFAIENGKLNDNVKLIKTKTGLHSSIDYYYDFGSVVHIDYEKRPRPKFDEKTSTIYLPLVDENLQMAKRFILYKFTGQYFERVKN